MTAAALAGLAFLLRATEPPGTGVSVTLQIRGAAVELSDDEQSQIAIRVEALMVGCGITSALLPDPSTAKSPSTEWRAARAGSHLYVRFSKPLLTRRSGIRMSEIVIGLEEPNLIGPELSRHGEEVVAHGKCDGHRALAVMCATAVRRYLLPGQKSNCKIYDTIGEPRERE